MRRLGFKYKKDFAKFIELSPSQTGRVLNSHTLDEKYRKLVLDKVEQLSAKNKQVPTVVFELLGVERPFGKDAWRPELTSVGKDRMGTSQIRPD